MTRHDFLQKQYELSVQAGTSQRYHQRYATWWWGWDTGIKIATAISAVIGVILSVASAVENADPFLVSAAVAMSIATTIVAVALNVVPFGNWEKDHRDLFRQWSEMREDVDQLELELNDGDPSDHVLHDFKKLAAKAQRLNGQEASPNESVVKKLYIAELKSRQFSDPLAAA